MKIKYVAFPPPPPPHIEVPTVQHVPEKSQLTNTGFQYQCQIKLQIVIFKMRNLCSQSQQTLEPAVLFRCNAYVTYYLTLHFSGI
jgi:hypothetical protein